MATPVSRLLLAAGVMALFILTAFVAVTTPVLEPSEITYVSKSDTPLVQLASVASGMNTVSVTQIQASPPAIPSGISISKPQPVVATINKTLPERMVQMEQPKSILAPFTIAAGQQPAPSLALSGAGGVPFTNFTLTAGDQDVTVHSITVQGTGIGDVRVFDSISLNDETGEDVSDSHFDATHSAIFRDEFVVPAHTSKTMSVVGNMTDDVSPYDGEMPQLSVIGVDASAPLIGVLPITGAPQTVNSTLTIGGATAELGQFDPGVDGTHYIGENAIKFGGIRITANSQEDLTLSSISWKQNGTANAADIANVTTVINGVSYPTTADGRQYTSTFSPGIVIAKGNSVEIYVMGDLTTTGAQRTAKFDIDSSDDISLTGNTYGYGVGIAADSNTAMTGDSVFITSDGSSDGDEGTPFYSAPTITISGGAVVNIQNATN